jgi:zinc D-Ala-D-Ala carboxypeptidase
MNLSEHFTLRELTRSQTAERLRIKNEPNSDQMLALKLVCENILEPVRRHYGIPFSPSSGFRSPELNEWIGGSANPISQHTKGEAVDFEIPGVSTPELAAWCRDNLLEWDQLICECWHPARSDSGWVHCSYGGAMRRDVLTYQSGKGMMNGLPG